jgi:hypothetical protein
MFEWEITFNASGARPSRGNTVLIVTKNADARAVFMHSETR